MEGDNLTVIDANCDVEGRLTGKDARILGKFKGEIALSGRLFMGEGSRVEAKVVADAAEIGGSYKGELNVRSLILLDKGRAEGVLDAKTLAVREGAQINGSINAGQAAASHGQTPAGHGHTAAAPAGGILGR
jgi:cytoskeletal protein CcmA (bactofilin family)